MAGLFLSLAEMLVAGFLIGQRLYVPASMRLPSWMYAVALAGLFGSAALHVFILIMRGL